MTKIVQFEGSKTVFNAKHIEELAKLATVEMIPKDASREQIKAKMKDADIITTTWGSAKFDQEILEQTPNLKLIMHCAGTVKGLVAPTLPYLIEQGIKVSSCNGPLGQGVAETALGLTIVSLKNIWSLTQYTRQEDHWFTGGGREKIKDIHDVTIGIISASKAGQHFIRLLQNFEVRVLVYDPILNDEQVHALGAERVSLEQLMSESDVVSIHAPAIPATDKLITAARLKLMKDHAVLINTARGTIVDEPALIAELQSGRISACLDVTDPEPPAADHPFRTLPNVILTPHLAGLSSNGLFRIGGAAVREIERLVQGEPLMEEVNLNILDVLA